MRDKERRLTQFADVVKEMPRPSQKKARTGHPKKLDSMASVGRATRQINSRCIGSEVHATTLALWCLPKFAVSHL
jgi:hypothetical protein